MTKRPIEIKCFQNAEKVINDVIKELKVNNQFITGLEVEENENSPKLILKIESDYQKKKAYVFKQYAKRNYASVDECVQKFNETMLANSPNPPHYEKVFELQTSKKWLLVFEEIKK